MNLKKATAVILLLVITGIALAPSAHFANAYTPQKGDFLRYSEITTVDNGQGSYTGYTDQMQTTGTEQVNSVSGNFVSSNYNYSYQYSNNQGSSTSSSSSGNFVWSLDNFTYVNGTDNQMGFGGLQYSRPLYVWFAMNPSLSVGSKFYVLNTQVSVLSKNYVLRLPSENKSVQTIQAEGTGQYQRNDSYGILTASYTWYEYFDPTTGYIVAYSYVEQDNGKYQGQVGNFTYTDSLYVTSTSFTLMVTTATGNPLTTTSVSKTGAAAEFPAYILYAVIAILVIVVTVVVVVYAGAGARGRRRDSLPKHSPTPYTPPPSQNPPPRSSPPPFQSNVDLGSEPPEQVVIRDVAKVNCKFCGTLIPTTADTCPYCGAPRN